MTEKDKKRFAEANTCWICKGKFAIDTEEIERLESKIVSLNEKLKKFDKKSAEYSVSKQLLKKQPRQLLVKKLRLIRSGITVTLQESFEGQLIIPVISNFRLSHGRPQS